MIRVQLPPHLRTLASVEREVTLEGSASPTQRTLLDELEARFPMLRGCVRDRETQQRRPLVRFLACGEDLSHVDPDEPLPGPVCQGLEPFVILGAIAGG